MVLTEFGQVSVSQNLLPPCSPMLSTKKADAGQLSEVVNVYSHRFLVIEYCP